MREITFRTRISKEENLDEMLSEYAHLLSKIERKLFVDLIKEKNINDLKRDYIKNYEITARQFNSCKFELDGKIRSFKERKKIRVDTIKQRIVHLDKKIKRYKNKNILHQKKRKLFNLKNLLKNLEEDNKIQICFGTKRLFKAQFYLKENGFKNFDEWKKKWQEKRSSGFFIVGSKDETTGNQTCQISKGRDNFSLSLRLPNKLIKDKKVIVIKDLKFAYGYSEIENAIEDNLQRNLLFKQKNALYKTYGTAISYRFKKDEKGWQIFVTLGLKEAEYISKKDNGVIGIDINSNHLAIVETDRFLNPIKSLKIPLNLYGKNKNQSLAIIGDASKEVLNLATKSQKPIIMEKLDFQKKKITLKENSNKFARLISSFSYTSIKKTIKSKAFRSKIEVFEVNPSFTTVIGKVKFAKRYGLNNHLSAALTIARRFMNASEKPPRKKNIKVFDAKGSMRAFLLPVRNRKKHLWSFWGQVFGLFKAMDAPYFQTSKTRSSSTHKTTSEIGISENCERDSHTLMSVDKTARSTSLKKSLLYV